MKHIVSLTFILFLVLAAYSQGDEQEMAFLDSRCNTQLITLNPNRKNTKLKNRFPYRAFEVVDYRPDSLRIGLFGNRKQLSDLRFNSSPGSTIQFFLNENYTNPLATKTLLVVIKDLWFSDIVDVPGATPSNFNSHIKFRVEAYVKEETGYVPMAYFDTLISSKTGVTLIAPFTMPGLIDAFIDKISAVDLEHANLPSKRHLSLGAVDSFSKRSFTYPVTVANTLKKGVYANFEEFRNNRPSVSNYDIDNEKDGSISLRLIDEQGKSYYSRRMWGYCDGQQTYVMMDGNLFPVIHYGRAFYVYGSKNYLVRKSNVPIFLLFPPTLLLTTIPVSERVTRNLRFFRLDIQTGEIQ